MKMTIMVINAEKKHTMPRASKRPLGIRTYWNCVQKCYQEKILTWTFIGLDIKTTWRRDMMKNDETDKVSTGKLWLIVGDQEDR